MELLRPQDAFFLYTETPRVQQHVGGLAILDASERPQGPLSRDELVELLGSRLQGVHRLAGVVDAGYRGEVRVVLANLGREPFAVEAGMKVAQILIQPVLSMDVEEAEELEDTVRGEGGFGSTGKY